MANKGLPAMHSGNAMRGANVLHKFMQRIKVSDMLIPTLSIKNTYNRSLVINKNNSNNN